MSRASKVLTMRSVIATGEIDIAGMQVMRSEIVAIRDGFDAHSLGTVAERRLLNDLAAQLCAMIALDHQR